MNLREKHNLRIKKVRLLELETVIDNLPADAGNKSLLEIGAGAGFQLAVLKNYFKEVKGIDIPLSNYTNSRVAEIIDYDGKIIPFPNQSFDVIFSSNTLEHIADLEGMNKEIKRVLKQGGIAVHVVPTSVWKFWNTLLHYPMLFQSIRFYFFRKKESKDLGEKPVLAEGTLTPKKRNIGLLLFNVIFPPLHGERGNRFTEIFYFRPAWWRTFFKKDGWDIVKSKNAGVYYSAHFMLPNANRLKLGKWLGSSCMILIVSPSKK
ncbi:MAG TPA: class I SAM-dependent methyltransferase [Phnomibacter sp.]|nr:class I SAM-dependent methyltransferase [Phnomibacter sp.]